MKCVFRAFSADVILSASGRPATVDGESILFVANHVGVYDGYF